MLEPNLESGRAAFTNRDYGQALDLLLPFALYGQAEAQCMIASIYHLGLGRKPDLPKAVEWYRQAAHQSYGMASKNLAGILAQGYGNMLPDPEAADHLYQKAREQGWSHAPKVLIDLMA
jgi:TPR repeat protein